MPPRARVDAASKDGTVAISELVRRRGCAPNVQLVRLPARPRRRSARWRDAHTMTPPATARPPQRVRRARRSRAAALSIEASSFALNTVLYSPRDSHVALVNDFEPVARLYDVRYRPAPRSTSAQGPLAPPRRSRQEGARQADLLRRRRSRPGRRPRHRPALAPPNFGTPPGSRRRLRRPRHRLLLASQDVGTTLGVVAPGGAPRRRAASSSPAYRPRARRGEPRWG